MEYILYIVLAITLWDFTIHVLDKFELGSKFTQSKSIFSYYYPHFWGKTPHVSPEVKKRRYDYFWISTWGFVSVLLIVYIVFH